MRTRHKQVIAKIIAALLLLASWQLQVAPAYAAGAASLMSDVLSRNKVSVPSVTHSVTLTLPTGGLANTLTLTLTYANFSAFAGSPTATCVGGGTASAAVGSGNVLTVTGSGSGCNAGVLTVTGFTGTNPGSAGSNTVTLGGSGSITGSFAVTTVTDDQVSVTASVDPTITFNVGANLGCTGAFSGNGGTVALGTITTAAVATSNGTSINNICTRVTTNAASGAAVTVTSANVGLKSTSTPADIITSGTATLTAGTQGYGLCAGSSGDSGRDSTTPAGATPAASSPYNSTCTNSGHSVGVVDGTTRTVWTLSGASQNAYFNLYVKAAIAGTQHPHTDYTDTLTFVATGTF